MLLIIFLIISAGIPRRLICIPTRDGARHNEQPAQYHNRAAAFGIDIIMHRGSSARAQTQQKAQQKVNCHKDL